ncbi:methylamine utilization protein [Marinomonas sp. IMCC 4694]|uniref:methylamine utilization protein n=1 Tax=Marinomonas sp. IMCC 4694 TaxID=2605432 RepID=UPI0011E72BFE|nr:methylamine utilization protein [Marinomonas sp. IMCC 4694]TYL47552.1 methylamine utilization protein [Marinomonas sp. IMCC 4694]
MRYLLALLCALALQNAYADMTLTVLDQKGLPVPDAVITLNSQASITPNTVAVMDQIDESFVPRVLVIQKGQYVRFPNSDDIRHHVYSFSKPKAFEIKLYKGSDIPPVWFDKPGLVALGCNIHDDMIGYIVVADNAFSVKTDRNGRATLPAKQGDVVDLWSERMLDGVTDVAQINIVSEKTQTITLELLPPLDLMDHSQHSGFGKKKW